SALMLCGCETEPDPGAPRAPLPSEVKARPHDFGAEVAPKSVPEILKELAEKKAKQKSAETAPTATTGPTAPGSGTPSAGAAAPEGPAGGAAAPRRFPGVARPARFAVEAGSGSARMSSGQSRFVDRTVLLGQPRRV